MKITGNESAMPWNTTESYNPIMGGLTIRQQFAMAAMQGILAKESFTERIANENEQYLANQIAVAAVVMADNLIAELNKEAL